MRDQRIPRFFPALAPLLFAAAASLFCNNALGFSSKDLCDLSIAQYTYKGPTQPVPGNSQLVRIEVLVRDSPKAGGLEIKSVEFNGEGVPLKPRDIFGNRGAASFQVPPGTYKLRWVVQRDKLFWPRVVTHEEEVNVDPRDLWLQISIEGEEASIR